VKTLILTIVFLVLFNLLFSYYALRAWKNYSEKFFFYQKLLRDNLILTRKIESKLNYQELLRYAERKGFKDVSLEDVVGFREFLTKGQSSGKSE